MIPVVGFILWQFMDRMATLMSVASGFIVLPILILEAFMFNKIVATFFKR